MGKIICFFLNFAILTASIPQRIFFEYCARNVEKHQLKCLKKILSKNAGSEYGRQHGFGEIGSIDEFRNRVSLSDYEDFLPWIDRIYYGAQGLLTKDEVQVLEPTSGSSSASKLIPYTKSLLKEFRKGISTWINDLYLRYPAIMTGKAYWSVTPAAMLPNKKESAIPIGFDEDSDYLGGPIKWLFEKLFIVPEEVALIQDIEQFRYITSLFLLKEKNLVFISLWNPTFLTLLLLLSNLSPSA